MTKTRKLLIAIPAALAVGGGIYGCRVMHPSVDSHRLRVSGNIEVTDVEVKPIAACLSHLIEFLVDAVVF